MKGAISVTNLGKSYVILHERQTARTVRDALTQGIRRMGKKALRHSAAPRRETFWALRQVSFEVSQGERVGVIGRNGAGKSTLLKLISRITEPTEGTIRVSGRSASLLEVGTGFHPELSGRENIFMNGAILGMGRSEIRSKFDEIVAFAEVETFIDTPVKRYSSGMYVRLAFAVAAHLEPDILVVDEVLSVGDAAFQRKCLGKMEAVSTEAGRTVLFVSHNMAAMRRLCSRSVLLSGGRIAAIGPTDDLVQQYLAPAAHAAIDRPVFDLRGYPRPAGVRPTIVEAWLENERGVPSEVVSMGESVSVCVRFEAARKLESPGFGFSIANPLGELITSYATYLRSNERLEDRQRGVFVFEVPRPSLLPGSYTVNLGLIEDPYKIVDTVQSAFQFTVAEFDLFQTGKPYKPGHGVVFLEGRSHYRE